MEFGIRDTNFYLSILLICITLSSCNHFRSSRAVEEVKNNGNEEAVPVIFDTDLGGDYDDVGALGMLHALADRGEVKILATLSSNLSPLVVPGISVINTYFGRPEVPIGSPKTPTRSQDSRDLHYHDSLIAHYPYRFNSTDEAPDAVQVYRNVLSQQPDTSVTIVSVGFLSNLKNLLMSKPDSISPLDGKELVAKKVKLWVAMAGKFPEGKEANVVSDPFASQYAIDHWPTPIVFSGFEIGVEVKTGLRLIKDGPAESPIRMVYALCIPKNPYDKEGRRSWDQTAVLVAARGFEPYYNYLTGQFITQEDGSNQWKDDPNGKHMRLIEKMSPDSVAYEIETLMMHRPN